MFSFLLDELVNAIKLGGIMQVLEIIKGLSFIVTMFVYMAQDLSDARWWPLLSHYM